MEILLIGGYIDDNDLSSIDITTTYIDQAANTFQKKLILGLDSHIKNIVSLPFIGTYPKYSNLKRCELKSNNSKIQYLDFFNLLYIRNIFRGKSLKKYLEKDSLSYDAIIIYSLHTPFLNACKYIKQKSNIPIYIVVPDLPEYMNLNKSKTFLYNYLKKHDSNIVYKTCNKYIDGYIFLTEVMKNKFDMENKKYCVINGILDDDLNTKVYANPSNKANSDAFTIVYSGIVNEKYGIKNLVEAFLKINEDNFRLVICGTGDYKEQLLSIKDSRINYVGFVSKDEAKKIQVSADLLVNPRMDDEFTKYSFPSKVFEYLSTGIPVVSYKIDCFGNDYDDKMFFCEEQTIDSLYQKIIEVSKMSSDELSNHYRNIEQFMNQNKPQSVAKKIINMMGGK